MAMKVAMMTMMTMMILSTVRTRLYMTDDWEKESTSRRHGRMERGVKKLKRQFIVGAPKSLRIRRRIGTPTVDIGPSNVKSMEDVA
jgi:hypothetical protein